MRSILVIVCLALLAGNSLAQGADESDEQYNALTDPDYCKNLGELAHKIMSKRQMGFPLSNMMEIAEGDPIVEEMVDAAWESRRVSDPAEAERYAQEYRDLWFAGCFKSKQAMKAN